MYMHIINSVLYEYDIYCTCTQVTSSLQSYMKSEPAAIVTSELRALLIDATSALLYPLSYVYLTLIKIRH